MCGIYTNLKLNVSRQYRPGDGVRDAPLLGYGKQDAGRIKVTPLAAEGRPLERLVQAERTNLGWRIPVISSPALKPLNSHEFSYQP